MFIEIYIIRSTEIPKISLEIKKQKLVQTIKDILFFVLDNYEISNLNLCVINSYNSLVMKPSVFRLIEMYGIDVTYEQYYSYDVYNKLFTNISQNSKSTDFVSEKVKNKIWVIDLDAVEIENINNLKQYYEIKRNSVKEIINSEKIEKYINI